MHSRLLVAAVACACLLSGCATGPNPRDPYEGFNRKVYKFNETVDKAVLKPVAQGYEKVVPQLARTGVSNFLNNLSVVVTAFNDAVQLKGSKVPVDIMRFTTNLVFGLGGVIDVATAVGIENRSEDFGQTLGYWGVGTGPYLVLPILGPSTVRDGAALPVDYVVSPFYWEVNDDTTLWSLLVLRTVDQRANLLGAERFLETAAIDRYAFLRDTYLQRREYLIHDGKPPVSEGVQRPKSLKELEEEDFGDEPVK